MLGKARRIVGRLAIDPDDDEPDTWAKESRRKRLWETAQALKYTLVSILLIGGGIAGYFQSYLPVAQSNPYVLGAGVYLGSVLLAYIYGRQKGIDALSDLDISVLFMPGSDTGLVPRYGKIRENASGEIVFNPIKSIGFGGYSYDYVSIKDHFPRSKVKNHKNKFKRASEDSKLRDRLEGFVTFVSGGDEYDIDLFRQIAVSHVQELEDDLSSKNTDRETQPPREIDSRLATKVGQELRLAEDEIGFLENSKSALEQRINELANMINEEESQVLSEVVGVLETLSVVNSNNVDVDGEESDTDSLESTLNGGDGDE